MSMNIDRRSLNICSYSVLFLLSLALFIPSDSSAWICALVASGSALFFSFFVKKRAIYSYLKNQILYLMIVMGVMYAVLYYMSGFYFGFVWAKYILSVNSFFTLILPVALAVVSSELLRAAMLAQNTRGATVLSYIICVICEVLALSTLPQIQSFYVFMDVLAVTLLPAIVSNLLYHYLSRRYGPYPNIAYRSIIGLFAYVIPYASAVPSSIYSIFRLLVPIPIYFFIDELYEKKRRYALGKKRIASWILSGVTVVIGVLIVMLISCQFRFGLLVVGSPSMTGEINKGDAVIYEEYTDQKIEKGRVIVFEKSNTKIIHRVVGVEIINNQRRYTTKGDANEDNDMGYITDSDVIGLVEAKIPFIGYPTIWLRSLFGK